MRVSMRYIAGFGRWIVKYSSRQHHRLPCEGRGMELSTLGKRSVVRSWNHVIIILKVPGEHFYKVAIRFGISLLTGLCTRTKA